MLYLKRAGIRREKVAFSKSHDSPTIPTVRPSWLVWSGPVPLPFLGGDKVLTEPIFAEAR